MTFFVSQLFVNIIYCSFYNLLLEVGPEFLNCFTYIFLLYLLDKVIGKYAAKCFECLVYLNNIVKVFNAQKKCKYIYVIKVSLRHQGLLRGQIFHPASFAAIVLSD